MIKWICFFALLITLFSCEHHRKVTVSYDVQKLLVNPDSCKQSYDLSTLLSDSVCMIPLETNDDCLIASIKKLRSVNDYIFISDDVTKKVLMFGDKGNFICCVGKQGDAPNEYGQLGNFEIKGDSILIQDIATRKYIVYDYMKHEYQKSIKYPYHHMDVMAIGNILYEVGSYHESEVGFYRIFRHNLKNDEIDLLLPFSSETNKKSNFFGLYNQICKNKNQALVYFPLNDTIFQINQNGITAKFEIIFEKNTISDEKKNTLEDLLSSGYEEGYILHPMYIQQSDEFIFESYTEGNEFRYLIMNKKMEDYSISKELIFNSLGGLLLMGKSFFIEDDSFFMCYSASSLLINGKNCLRNEFANKPQLKEVMSSLNEEGNPVLFKMKFK